MKQWIAITMVAAFATGAAAQTAAPYKANTKEQKQADVKATTDAAAAETTGAQTAKEAAANVKASKQTTKMTTAEKNKAIKDVNKQMVNPENPSGSVAGTAAQQKANVAESKGQPREKVKLNTLGPKSEMEKAATK